MASLSSSAFDCRRAIRNEVLRICERAGANVYGSFANGAFHLDIENWKTLSDIDLISSDLQPNQLSSHISFLIKDRLDLTIQVKVRKNKSHIDRLPKSVSKQLAYIDTALALIQGVERNVNHHYLFVKYLLRTIYLDRYLGFDEQIFWRQLHGVRYENDIFFILMRFKTAGSSLKESEFIRIITHLNSINAEYLSDFRSLFTLRDIEDICPHWLSFSTNAATFGLHDLVEDIARKIKVEIDRKYQTLPLTTSHGPAPYRGADFPLLHLKSSLLGHTLASL